MAVEADVMTTRTRSASPAKSMRGSSPLKDGPSTSVASNGVMKSPSRVSARRTSQESTASSGGRAVPISDVVVTVGQMRSESPFVPMPKGSQDGPDGSQKSTTSSRKRKKPAEPAVAMAPTRSSQRLTEKAKSDRRVRNSRVIYSPERITNRKTVVGEKSNDRTSRARSGKSSPTTRRPSSAPRQPLTVTSNKSLSPLKLVQSKQVQPVRQPPSSSNRSSTYFANDKNGNSSRPSPRQQQQQPSGRSTNTSSTKVTRTMITPATNSLSPSKRYSRELIKDSGPRMLITTKGDHQQQPQKRQTSDLPSPRSKHSSSNYLNQLLSGSLVGNNNNNNSVHNQRPSPSKVSPSQPLTTSRPPPLHKQFIPLDIPHPQRVSSPDPNRKRPNPYNDVHSLSSTPSTSRQFVVTSQMSPSMTSMSQQSNLGGGNHHHASPTAATASSYSPPSVLRPTSASTPTRSRQQQLMSDQSYLIPLPPLTMKQQSASSGTNPSTFYGNHATYSRQSASTASSTKSGASSNVPNEIRLKSGDIVTPKVLPSPAMSSAPPPRASFSSARIGPPSATLTSKPVAPVAPRTATGSSLPIQSLTSSTVPPLKRLNPALNIPNGHPLSMKKPSPVTPVTVSKMGTVVTKSGTGTIQLKVGSLPSKVGGSSVPSTGTKTNGAQSINQRPVHSLSSNKHNNAAVSGSSDGNKMKRRKMELGCDLCPKVFEYLSDVYCHEPCVFRRRLSLANDEMSRFYIFMRPPVNEPAPSASKRKRLNGHRDGDIGTVGNNNFGEDDEDILEIVPGARVGDVLCDFCTFSFETSREYQRHLHSQHLDNFDMDTDIVQDYYDMIAELGLKQKPLKFMNSENVSSNGHDSGHGSTNSDLSVDVPAVGKQDGVSKTSSIVDTNGGQRVSTPPIKSTNRRKQVIIPRPSP